MCHWPGDVASLSVFGRWLARKTTTLILLAENWNWSSTRRSPSSVNSRLLDVEFYKIQQTISSNKLLCGKLMFLHLSVGHFVHGWGGSLSSGISVPGSRSRGSLSTGGSLSFGVFFLWGGRGYLSREGLCLGGFCPGVGGLCPGVSVQGVSVRETPERDHLPVQ